MISNCNLYRINRSVSIFSFCYEELWKKDADTGTPTVLFLISVCIGPDYNCRGLAMLKTPWLWDILLSSESSSLRGDWSRLCASLEK